MNTPDTPTPADVSRSVRRRVGLLALAILLVLGVILTGYIIRTRFPNLLDREIADAGRIAQLQQANLERPAADAETGPSWPQWRGPLRDGHAPAGEIRTNWSEQPPEQVWTVPCGGGFSSFAVVEGKAYTQDRQGNNERVLCVDAATGNTLWQHEYPADYAALRGGYTAGPRATPTVHDGAIYTLGAAGHLICLEPPAQGESQPRVRWEHHLAKDWGAPTPNWGFASSPLIEGKLVIVQAGDKAGSVVALDRKTGTLKWKAGTAATGYSSPIAMTVGGVRQIVAVTGESILGVRPDNGSILWEHPWVTAHNGNIATPIAVGEYVFVSSGYSKGCVLLKLDSAADNTQASVVYFRKGRVMKNHHSSSVFHDGFLYGFDDNVLRCVDLRAGEEVEAWMPRNDATRPITKGSLIVAGQHMIGLTESGNLFCAALNPDEFELRGVVPGILEGSQCWAAPVCVDGRLYIRDSSKIICLNVAPNRP